MLSRSWLVILWLGAFVGCVSGDFDAPSGEIIAAPGSPVLEATPSPLDGLLPNESVELRVRYRDAAGQGIAGIQVDFTLAEIAPGASLAPWRAVTDSEGVATTRLTVGSMPGQLVVRAGAREASSVYMQVHVGEVVKTRLAVQVAYAGTRKLGTYVVTAVPALACAQALASGAVGEVVHRFAGGDEAVDFELDARDQTAVVAWGRDASGSQLARGCAEFGGTSEAPSDAALVLPLADTPLRIAKPVPLALTLRTADSASRLDALAREALADLLAPFQPEHAPAALHLDALATQLDVAREALSVHRAALTARLASAEAGPEPLARALGAQLARRGAGLVLQTRLGGSEDVPTVESLHAVALDDGSVLALDARPALALRSAFDAGEAKLTITSLSVALSLGAYGNALLRALDAADEARLEEAAGCRDVVVPWVVAQELADAQAAQAACEQVTAGLRARYEARLDALAAAPLELSGSLQARDRSEDGVVDELGPSALSGRWLNDDAVEGEVRMPAQSTLAR